MAADTLISAFHASPHDDLDTFKAGTHFGSYDAALERSAARKFDGLDMTIYEVEITLRNPLTIFDEGGSHDVEYLVAAIRAADRKAISRFAADLILSKAADEGEAAGAELLWEAMRGRGDYDGLCYLNNAEGSSDAHSWIIFDPAQVRVIAKHAVSCSAPTIR